MIILPGIPMPPSANHAYPTAKSGVRFKSKEYILWLREVKHWAYTHHHQINMAKARFKDLKPECYVFIQTDFCFPYSKVLCLNGKPKKMDTSNRIKLLHDAIADCIGLDDCYFFDGYFRKIILPDGHIAKVDVRLDWVHRGSNISGLGV